MIIQGLLLAMYLSATSLAFCCCPGGKKSASSRKINLGHVKERTLGDVMDKLQCGTRSTG